MSEATRPAFYALAPGGWRDYVTLLHPPYTAWHLSYVVVGATIAPRWRPSILALALAAFFLGMGVAAHALDELRGRPLQTRIREPVLWTLAAVSLAAAVAIGVVASLDTTLWVLPFVGVGAFITVSYNLELFAGRLHNTASFVLTWGALPVVATYVAAAETLRLEAVLAAAFAGLLTYVQRVLSTPVRAMRRREGHLTGYGRDAERALQLLSAAMVSLAVALVLMRVT